MHLILRNIVQCPTHEVSKRPTLSGAKRNEPPNVKWSEVKRTSNVQTSNVLHLLFLLLIFSSCFSQKPAPKVNEIKVQQVIYKNEKFDIVTIDLRTTPVRFFWKNKKGKLIRSLGNLKTEVESNGNELLFAMNAGMYQRDRNPQGLYIENGKTIKPLDTLQSGYGNFYMQPNGVFFIKNLPDSSSSIQQKAGVVPSTIFSKKNIQATWATQSGPLLLIDNKVHPIFKKGSAHLNIRNGVGIISEHKIVFAISQREVNLFDFAMLFKEKLNCKNALYLDGFVSRAYIPELKRLELDGNFGVMVGVVGR